MIINQNLESFWKLDGNPNDPDKGWYIHYYSNGLERYGKSLEQEQDYLDDFPNLDHIYMRLHWSLLEPQEGCFNWDPIDRVLEAWVERGVGIAFRVCCKETDPDKCYATPKWIKEQGVPGIYSSPPWGGAEAWAPDYDHPLFLEKLEAFHQTFAIRYAKQPWVKYIDVGSYGDWGEGHNHASNFKDWPAQTIMKHLEVHKRCYPDRLLVVSDDFIGSREIEDGATDFIADYIVDHGFTFRDDSICVDHFRRHYGKSCLRNPELFERVWREKPTIIEMDHYGAVVKNNTWENGEPLEEAIRRTHATYAGFHFYPREWLEKHREYAMRIGRLCGYQFRLQSVEHVSQASRLSPLSIKLRVLNAGVAPAYKRYSLSLKLCHKNSECFHITTVHNCDTRQWQPDSTQQVSTWIALPTNFPTGECHLGVKLEDPDGWGQRTVSLALENAPMTENGYRIISSINIV